MLLNNEQFAILDHTLHRASAGRYCGDSPDMQALVAAGLMQSLGKAGWCPDEFFGITGAGREAFKAERAARNTRAFVNHAPAPKECSPFSRQALEDAGISEYGARK
jgi:hypothetical protein